MQKIYNKFHSFKMTESTLYGDTEYQLWAEIRDIKIILCHFF